MRNTPFVIRKHDNGLCDLTMSEKPRIPDVISESILLFTDLDEKTATGLYDRLNDALYYYLESNNFID